MEQLFWATLKYYQLLCFNFCTQVAPRSPLTLPLLFHAALERRRYGGPVGRPPALRQMEVVKQRRSSHGHYTLTLPVPQPLQMADGVHQWHGKPQAFQTQFSPALIIPLSIPSPRKYWNSYRVTGEHVVVHSPMWWYNSHLMVPN